MKPQLPHPAVNVRHAYSPRQLPPAHGGDAASKHGAPTALAARSFLTYADVGSSLAHGAVSSERKCCCIA
jgi:hypothetical protein